MNKKFIRNRDIFVFAFPALAIFTIFVVYPIFPQVLISFQEHDGFAFKSFVGIDNYKDIFFSKPFWKSEVNTYIIVLISLFIAIPFSLFLALFMDLQSEKLRRFLKITTVLPALLSVTVIAQMWVAIYEPTWGLLNTVLRTLGLENLTRTWLVDKKTVMGSISIAFLWQYIGLNALLFYTGIKAIPKSFNEAAVIDGARFLKRSIYVTIPLLQDVFKYVLVISTLGCMAQFSYVRILTSGGPGYTSRTIIYQMYYTAFTQSDFGTGSSIAIIFIIQCIFISIIINKYVAKEKIEY